MIDAYTIGVTLALEDGVSAGLATIRAELVDVLAVTEQATAALAALRAMAGEVTGVAPPVLRPRPPARAETPVPEAALASPRVPAAEEAADQPIAPGPRVAIPPVASVRDQPRAREAAPIAPAAPLLIAPATITASGVTPPAIMEHRIEQRRDAASAPEAARAPTAMAERQGAVAPVTPVVVPDTPEMTPPQTVRIEASMTPSAAAAQPIAPATTHARPARGAKTVHRRAPAAPRATPEILRGTEMRAPEQSAERAPRRERDGDRETGGDMPHEGTIHLDGAVLGAWIEDYLTHRLSRPRQGGTGFDARMTPAWPGMALE